MEPVISQTETISTPQNHAVLKLNRLFFIWVPLAIFLSALFLLVTSFIASFDNYQLYYQYAGADIFSLSLEMSTGVYSLSLLFGVCLGVILIFVEIYCIRRLLQIRKSSVFVKKIIFLRCLASQLYASGVIIVAFFMIPLTLFVLSNIFAYLDFALNQTPPDSYITNPTSIIEYIEKEQSPIKVLSAKNELALKFANLDINNVYGSFVLPLLSQMSYLNPLTEPAYLFPDKRNIVLVSSDIAELQDILLAITYNQLAFNEYEPVRQAFATKVKPTVKYVGDAEYSEVLHKYNNQQNQKIIDEMNDYISYNLNLLAECTGFEISNRQNIEQDEIDYRKNCVEKTNYDNCSEFRGWINEDIRIAEENILTCKDTKQVVAEQRNDLQQFIQEVDKEGDDVLHNAKYDDSIGIAFLGTLDIFMRVLNDTSNYEYLHTLVHEHLHQYSDSNNLTVPQFVDEGITDYITYRTFDFTDYELAQDSVTGYYRENQIVLALLEKIPESELIDFYFGEGPDDFRDVFIKYFPEVNYDEFVSKGEEVFKDTFGVSDVTYNIGFWDMPENHILVRELRLFMGLDEERNYYID